MEKLTHDSLPTMPQGNLLEVLKLGEPSRAFQIGTKKSGLQILCFHASSPTERLSSVTWSQQAQPRASLDQQSIQQKCEPSSPNVGTFRAALCDYVYNFQLLMALQHELSMFPTAVFSMSPMTVAEMCQHPVEHRTASMQTCSMPSKHQGPQQRQPSAKPQESVKELDLQTQDK